MKKESQSTTKNSKFHRFSKTALKGLFGFFAAPIKMVLRTLLTIVIVLLLTVFVGAPLFSKLFQMASPVYQQRIDIADKNNLNDAFSSLEGMDVDKISQNAFIKFFSKKESEEVHFYIPKIKNESPLFNDTSELDVLKSTLINSINTEEMAKSSAHYKLYYNDSPIAEWEGKRLVWNFNQLKKEEKSEIIKDIDTQVSKKLKKNLGDTKIEDYQLYDNGNKVKVQAIFKSNKFNPFSKSYTVKTKYMRKSGEWKVIKGSLEVEEVK